jgi:ATP-dependent Lon protease
MTTDNNDIRHVEDVLNKSHYGLEKVKERIVEYLAVRARSPQSKAPIICLVGPPGVGKSTLARSIAEALDKKFVKMSLGGVRDEAEIRGHRKTYIGSMPGRIIKAMKQAGVVNPLFLLDELDKMTSDMRGDPASAMLEVLDPEQNNKFSDNYIEEDYDLSKVMFVATANYAEQIPAPLFDRLEIIELTSYTEREKLEIAKKYLVPKIRQEAAISDQELEFTDQSILHIIRRYTQEAGVRQLDRLLQKIARKFVVRQQHKEIKSQVIDEQDIVTYLKKEIYEYNMREPTPIPGVVNGMAYTTAGGDLLPIEVTYFKGKGNISITGNLKETMKESAQVALGYVKANSEKFGIKDIDFNKTDIHIHVPSGGIPKDGPSAGVTLTTAIISALSNRPVPNNIAMTGEITLRGRVGIIGGVKEKVISAFRGGINEIFMPLKDERFLEEVPNEVAEKIKFHFVEYYHDIYKSIFGQ